MLKNDSKLSPYWYDFEAIIVTAILGSGDNKTLQRLDAISSGLFGIVQLYILERIQKL